MEVLNILNKITRTIRIDKIKLESSLSLCHRERAILTQIELIEMINFEHLKGFYWKDGGRCWI